MDAYEQGYRARYEGKANNKCPYEDFSDEWFAWSLGFDHCEIDLQWSRQGSEQMQFGLAPLD